jgi:HlyD family secretion protein
MTPLRKNAQSFVARNRWWMIAAGIVAAVILLAAFNSMRGQVITVRAARIVRGNIRSAISTNGKIEPVRNFEAHAPAATTVKRILVREGDHVKRGQLLMELDDADARTAAARALAQLRTAQADISAVSQGGTREEVLTTDAQLVKARADRDAARRNLDAMRRLVKNGAASTGELKDAENQFQTAQANVELLEKKLNDRYSKPEVAKVVAQRKEAEAALHAAQDILSKSNVRAPFDGIVYSVPVHDGNFVNPGDLLLEVGVLSQVRLRAYIDEPDLGRLAPGQKIEATWDAIPGRVWQGTLSSVPATVKLYSTRHVGEITTELQNADLKLLPNTNVTVQVITKEHENVLIAPREAVRIDDNPPYIYVVSDDTLHRRVVQTSIFNLTQVEVTQGVTDNQLVALGPIGNKPMRDGQPVKVIQ